MDRRSSILKALAIPASRVNTSLTLRPVPGDCFCAICQETEPCFELFCGHKFCRYSLENLCLAAKTAGRPVILCPECNLGRLMHSDIVALCGVDLAMWTRRCLLKNSPLRQHRQCRGDNCERVLTVGTIVRFGVAVCECGYKMCWSCGQDFHIPCTCAQVDEWRQTDKRHVALIRAQRIWEMREERLVAYRSQHPNEVTAVLAREVKGLTDVHTKKEREEVAAIAKLRSQRKGAQSKDRDKLDSQIAFLERQMKMAKQERDAQVAALKEEHQLRVGSLGNDRMAEFYRIQLAEKQALRVFMSEKAHTSDELIDRLTKKCGKCGSRIEKNGGCNYMMCGKCRYEFCWVCGESWATHGDHFTCNKFEGKATQGFGLNLGEIREEELQLHDPRFRPEPIDFAARDVLRRFAHYHERWQAHTDSAMAEKKARQSADVAGWISHFRGWTTAERAKEMLLKAYRAIDDARQILIWTYPYAYLLKAGSPELSMFEINQAHLELTNERVVRIVEQTWPFETAGELDRCIELLERYKDVLLDDVEAQGGR
jgi:hypothetical protein